jgi:hypothetical protein
VSEIIVTLKKRHINQEAIMQSAKRFNVLKCGRRFGKTSLAEELIIEPALDGFPVAYYAPTYKDLNDFWINIIAIVRDAIATKNEQLKQIRLVTGGIIDMWSLDDPESGRGRKYKRVVIDECEKVKKLDMAWQGTIRATLTDYIGDAWFLSTPKFGDTYFKEIHGYKDDPKFSNEWQGWTYTTYDNPYMSPSEIDSARQTLADIYFRCEYLAEDVVLKGMLWAFAFDKEKHVRKVEVDKNKLLYLSFDFNRNPICCSVVQWYGGRVRFVETIKLADSDIYKLCDVILAKYPNFQYIVTGDATGQSSSALVKDNINYYTVIKNKLNIVASQLRVPKINPSLEENQVLFNSIFVNYPIDIDPDNCKGLIYDLQNVKTLPDGHIDKSNRQDDTKQADALDTARYWFNVFMWDFLKKINIR